MLSNVVGVVVVAVDVLDCCGVPFSFLLRRAIRCHNERDGTAAAAAAAPPAGGRADLAEGSSRIDEEDDEVDDDDAEELVDSTEWLLWRWLP